MNKNYINGIGIYDRFFSSTNELKSALFDKDFYLKIKKNDTYDDISLNNRSLIQREDRAVLNKISIMAINALNDLFSHNKIENISCLNIYTACDYLIDVTGLCRFLKDLLEIDENNFWKNMSVFSNVVNPLQLLRCLSTNTLYHLSKVLNSNQKGIPVDAGNISSIACLDLLSNNNGEALIVSVSDKLGIKDLVINNKENIIDILEPNYDKYLNYSANAIYIGAKQETSLAHVIDINMQYAPDKSFHLCLQNMVSRNKPTPDYFIVVGEYGEKYQQASEEILDKYSCAKLLDYRNLTGISGRSEIIMNIICCLLDDSIKNHSIICINGYDRHYGFGQVFIQKLI